jgi:sulfatase maturation enzyme AslB (radical SAM superfamily)
MSNNITQKPFSCAFLTSTVNVSTDGGLSACGGFISPININKKSPTEKYHIWDDLTQAFNSQTMTGWRTEMNNGVWPEHCARCKLSEKHKLQSMRQKYNDYVGDFVPDLNPNMTLNQLKIKTIELRFGNECNLQCVMCSSYCSSKWMEDHYYQEDENATLNPIEKINWKWFKDNKILEKYLKDPTVVIIKGGEPWLTRAHWDFVKKLVAMGLSKNIILIYNTNATLWSDKWLDVWKNFQKVSIICSLDGVGELNNNVRYLSDWSVIETNLHKINDAYETNQLKGFRGITYTLHHLNAYGIKDFLDWQSQNFIKWPVYINLVSTPMFLSLSLWSDQEIEKWVKYASAISDANFQKQLPFIKDLIAYHAEKYQSNVYTKHQILQKRSDFIKWWNQKTGSKFDI